MLAAMLCGAVIPGILPWRSPPSRRSIVRSTLGDRGIALAVLFVLPVAGVYHPIAGWLPSALVTDAPAALIGGTQHLPHYLPAFAVAVAASGAALAATVLRLRARQILTIAGVPRQGLATAAVRARARGATGGAPSATERAPRHLQNIPGTLMNYFRRMLLGR